MYYNKYHNKKTEYNGIMYDSKKEANRAFTLDMLLRAGKIKDLERQKRFVLQDKYTNNQGKNIRAIEYVADFYYYDVDSGRWIAEDTKGMKTDVYLLKKKIFEYKYPEIIFIES